ncbi:MAG TPA: exodeoxyribonuclease VII large subunit [Acidimicrobiales bacterium]|nr:exodeoxyribonuclease VII large subunit [Acidimicrobiales bacterium]
MVEPSEDIAGVGSASPTWSVGELSRSIGERLREAFPGEVWVRGEIHDLNRARSGHVYFTLRDPDDPAGRGVAAAQLSVMLSSTHKVRVNRLLLRGGGRVRMTDGTEVRIRGRVDWYEPRGQLQLQMTSIDPAFTLGQLAAARAELLDRLRAEGLVGANALLPLPLAPLRIGLVTSAGSAAEADVLHTLTQSGFAFEISMADVRVQGPEAPGAIAGAITGLSRTRVDLLVVARGGGAATDLAAFDSELVARAIAGAQVPVITGIGHEVDRSVADEVAHTAAKTPTAAAQQVVALVAEALDRAEQAWHGIAVRAVHALDRADAHLDRARARAGVAARSATHRELDRIDHAGERLARCATSVVEAAERRLADDARRLATSSRRRLDDAAGRLDVLATRAHLLDPVRAMERGWAIVRDGDGRVVRSVDGVDPGAALSVRLADGTLHATVDRVDHDGSP